jgi:hypothetical protein
VTAEIAAERSGKFQVIVGESKLSVAAPKTGDYAKFQKVELGQVEITATGKTSLAVKAVKEGWQPFNFTGLTLTPVK